MQNIIFILIGGGLGSVARYLLTSKINILQGWHIPLATMSVNILGSFLIVCFYALSDHFSLPQHLRLMLTTGLCGGFTTFSTFSYENIMLLKNGQIEYFLLYTTLSLILCIAGAGLGAYLFMRH